MIKSYYASAEHVISKALAQAFAPRPLETVSGFADKNIVLSSKETPEPGRWDTSRTPLLREIQDCFSAKSPVREVVVKIPIQFGKTMVLRNVAAYLMVKSPAPIMVITPTETLRDSLVQQKFNTLFENTECLQQLMNNKSRDSENQKFFKEGKGFQLFFEHAGAPGRLKMKSIKYMLLDEATSIARALPTGESPWEMIKGRVTAFSETYKILACGSPGIEGFCLLTELYDKSDKRLYHVPCPHCDEKQPLEWRAFEYDSHGKAEYICQECACVIHERYKTDMFENGIWVPRVPGIAERGYTASGLYYSAGLGPGWKKLAQEWRDAQGDISKLQVFITDRLGEAFKDPKIGALQLSTLSDRAESYTLRRAPSWVCAITAGFDTQDDRLEGQIVGWGVGLKEFIVLDYLVINGDPNDEATWNTAADVLNTPIETENGHFLPVLSTLFDAGGHRTEAVKHFVRQRRIMRPIAAFGAKAINAPVLDRGKPSDVTWNGRTDKKGLYVHHVGTIAIKDWLFGQIAADAKDHDAASDARRCHFSQDLPPEYFNGLAAETFNRKTKRYDKKPGARNESLDTLVYARAACYHPKLRLHLYTDAQWESLLKPLQSVVAGNAPPVVAVDNTAPKPKPKVKKARQDAEGWW